MDIEIVKANAATLNKELQWLELVIETRIKLYFENPAEYKSISDIVPPELILDSSQYAQLIKQHNLDFAERVILITSLVPHIQPQLLDVFFARNSKYDRAFTEFGGIKGQHHSGFLPTGETIAFVLAGDNLEERFSILRYFSNDHLFRKLFILKLTNTSNDEPFLSGMLVIEKEYRDLFAGAGVSMPDCEIDYCCNKITTELFWNDLLLDEHTLGEVSLLDTWLRHSETILNDQAMKKKIKPGYCCLFYGLPGTGKTLTACLLGKSAGIDVYRIDLSMLVSKYIGETEKNISNIFERSANKRSILFFDEADALFEKHTQTDSSDKSITNPALSYLLQRIEDYPGMIIITSYLKPNTKQNLTGLFQSEIYFPKPGVAESLKLWQNIFSSKIADVEDTVSFEDISENYQITGGTVINVLRYCCIRALNNTDNKILLRDILEGIRRELIKDEK